MVGALGVRISPFPAAAGALPSSGNQVMAAGSTAVLTEDTVIAALIAAASTQLVSFTVTGAGLGKIKLTYSDATTETIVAVGAAPSPVANGSRSGLTRADETEASSSAEFNVANATKAVTKIEALVGASAGAGTRTATIAALQVSL